jgi:NodT family efflux transporter outer membrane factor (OMF) lipoprotein
MTLYLPACNMFSLPAVDLAPGYKPAAFVVPDSWRGSSPFVEAQPSDGELRQDWWTLFNDPNLNKLEEQALAANPDLQAAAERFIQVRDMMMKARSRLVPQLGFEFGASGNKDSVNSLFRAPDDQIYGTNVHYGGIASWEPDFWSAIRNETRVQIYRAEQRAADFALARLSLQAEIAEDYFTLRGYDAQNAIYRQSIEYYQKSLNIINDQFIGKIASDLDVARAEYLLHSTEAKQIEIQTNRQITEHAIAILVNMSPSSFEIAPVDELQIAKFQVPQKIPASLLERRPDIASMEREMAQANREIGIARAAFYPNVVFHAGGGFADQGFNLAQLANSLWSYGSTVSVPIFDGGYRRAQLQQSWSAYRETEDKYRSTVLNAFREVENSLSRTKLITTQVERQDAAVDAAVKTQYLSMELYKGGLNSSLDLIYAQVNTLTARIDAVAIKNELQKASVALIRSLGGGWDRKQLPAEEQIQPFDSLQFTNLAKPEPAGGIDVKAGFGNTGVNNNLTTPAVP